MENSIFYFYTYTTKIHLTCFTKSIKLRTYTTAGNNL